MNQFKVQKNTDSVDIESNCIGLSSWVVGDSISKLNSNRGLHTQIKHNKNKDTFEAANQLANLFAAAPEMLECIATIYSLANLQITLEKRYSKALVSDIMKMMENVLHKVRS